MTHDEMRFLRRELINYHLQNYHLQVAPSCQSGVFRLRDIKFLVRNGEVYRYGHKLNLFKVQS